MNQFITKAQTPLQFAPMITVKESKDVQKWYKKHLYQIKNVQLSLYSSEWSIIQRILSLRGQDYFSIIRTIAETGNTIGNWKKILKIYDSDLDQEALWTYSTSDSLPWDKITLEPQKKALISAFKRYNQFVNSEKSIKHS